MTICSLHQHGNITFRRSHLRDHSVKWFINFFRSLYSIFLSAHWQIKQPARSKSRHDTQSFILDVPSDASQFNHRSREENRFMVYDSAPLKKKLSHESCDYKSLFNCYQWRCDEIFTHRKAKQRNWFSLRMALLLTLQFWHFPFPFIDYLSWQLQLFIGKCVDENLWNFVAKVE